MKRKKFVRLRNLCSIVWYGFTLGKISLFSLVINLIILIYSLCNYQALLKEDLWWFLFLVFTGVIWQFYSLIKDFVELLRYPDYSCGKNFLSNEITLSEEVKHKYPQTIINDEIGIYTIFSKALNNFLYHNETIQLVEERAKNSPLNDYINQNKDLLLLFLKTKWYSNPRAAFYNEEKLCLTSEINTATSTDSKVLVRRGNYYNSYVTNEIYCKCLLHNDRTATILPPHNPKVLPLTPISSLAPFGNHIGASTMALTTDGQLIVLFHNNRAAVQPNAYQPTCSGSADYSDWKRLQKSGKVGLADFIREVVARELEEETKIKPDVIEKTEVVGLFRDVIRGGKPDFCTLSYLNISYHEARSLFKPDSKEVSRTFEPIPFLENGKYDLQGFEHFIESHKQSISPSLYMSYIFLRDRFTDSQK